MMLYLQQLSLHIDGRYKLYLRDETSIQHILICTIKKKHVAYLQFDPDLLSQSEMDPRPIFAATGAFDRANMQQNSPPTAESQGTAPEQWLTPVRLAIRSADRYELEVVDPQGKQQEVICAVCESAVPSVQCDPDILSACANPRLLVAAVLAFHHACTGQLTTWMAKSEE